MEFKIGVIYKSGVKVEVFTDDDETAMSFLSAFGTNPDVDEVTYSKKGTNGYRHIFTATDAVTTIPV